VLGAARAWAAAERGRRPDLLRLGVFGSYARGDAGVGSDIDLVAVVRQASEPFVRRAAAWDITSLPVPAEILVYTEAEWRSLQERGGKFADMLATTTVWLVG
jgi:predicted nucleotidyltransferase